MIYTISVCNEKRTETDEGDIICPDEVTFEVDLDRSMSDRELLDAVAKRVYEEWNICYPENETVVRSADIDYAEVWFDAYDPNGKQWSIACVLIDEYGPWEEDDE